MAGFFSLDLALLLVKGYTMANTGTHANKAKNQQDDGSCRRPLPPDEIPPALWLPAGFQPQ